jgi:hypothetical protein
MQTVAKPLGDIETLLHLTLVRLTDRASSGNQTPEPANVRILQDPAAGRANIRIFPEDDTAWMLTPDEHH